METAPQIPGGWAHKLYLKNLESIEFEAYKPGWAPPAILEKKAYKTGNVLWVFIL